MASSLTLVHSVLGSQHELVTRTQLYEAGVSRRQLDGLLRARLLVRVRREVFALAGARACWERTIHAATLAAGEGAIASHAAAARLHNFRYRPEDALELTIPRERCVHLEGVRVHRTLILPDCDITEREGVPCTSFERTLCDNTSELSEFQLGRTLDDGLRRQVASLKALAECLERLESGPRRRLAQVRRLLAQRGIGFDPGGSNAELRIRDVLHSAGLPPPEQQYRVRVGTMTYILDYAYPERMRFIEYYELRSHSSASAVAYDNQRLTDLSKVGWHPLVFTDASSDRRIVEDTAEMLGIDLATLDGP